MLASTVVHVQWLVSNSTQQHCIIETHDKAVIYRTCFFSVMGLRHAENQQINRVHIPSSYFMYSMQTTAIYQSLESTERQLARL